MSSSINTMSHPSCHVKYMVESIHFPFSRMESCFGEPIVGDDSSEPARLDMWIYIIDDKGYLDKFGYVDMSGLFTIDIFPVILSKEDFDVFLKIDSGDFSELSLNVQGGDIRRCEQGIEMSHYGLDGEWVRVLFSCEEFSNMCAVLSSFFRGEICDEN